MVQEDNEYVKLCAAVGAQHYLHQQKNGGVAPLQIAQLFASGARLDSEGERAAAKPTYMTNTIIPYATATKGPVAALRAATVANSKREEDVLTPVAAPHLSMY